MNINDIPRYIMKGETRDYSLVIKIPEFKQKEELPRALTELLASTKGQVRLAMEDVVKGIFTEKHDKLFIGIDLNEEVVNDVIMESLGNQSHLLELIIRQFKPDREDPGAWFRYNKILHNNNFTPDESMDFAKITKSKIYPRGSVHDRGDGRKYIVNDNHHLVNIETGECAVEELGYEVKRY